MRAEPERADAARRRSPRSPRLGGQVEHQGPPRRGGLQRRRQLRHQHMRDHTGEPRARSEHHQISGHDRVDRLAGGRRITRQQAHPADLARRRRDRHLPADHPAHPRIAFQTGHVGFDLQRDRAHRQHPALDAENPAQLVERGHRIGQQLVEAGQHQVADGMPGQRATAAEPMLDDGRPQPAVRTVGCQGRQRHSQITRRNDVELAAQPAGGPAIVGDGDHRGDVVGEPAGRGQRRVQTMATAEGDDTSHSRPRSRCRTRTVKCSLPSSRPASASAMATLRCLPPVQPMATVI